MTSNFTKKIKLLFIPFLWIEIGYCVLYSFLNWLFMIKLQVFPVKEMLVEFLIPGCISGLLLLFYFRPRLNLLNLKVKKGSWTAFYMLIMWLILSIPVISLQIYLKKATGALTKLSSISEIGKHKPSKYYTVRDFYLDKNKIGVAPVIEVSGKNNEHLNIHLYVAVPMFASKADTSNCLAWLGIEYDKQINNRLSNEEKEKKYQEFLKKSQLDFDQKDVYKFVYLDRLGHSDDEDGFKEAISKFDKKQVKAATVLLPINEPFEDRMGNTLPTILLSLVIGSLIWLIMVTIPGLNKYKVAHFESGKPQKKDTGAELLEFLKPRPGFVITPIIIYTILGIYVLMCFMGLGFVSFQTHDLLNWGANFKPLTVNGDWWRLLTSIFLHGGLMHLLNNIYGLILVGFILEPLLGKTKFLLLYLLTGILASCASIWWHDASVSVGASGAIFGLYGFLIALLLTKVFPPEFGKAFLISTLVFVGFNLVMGLAGGIDNAAHIGGLLSGLIIGILYRFTFKPEEKTTNYEQRS